MNLAVNEPAFTLRVYRPADENAAIELWRRTWQAHYAHLNFSERLDWWRARWRDELVPSAAIIVAEQRAAIIGFVTIDAKTSYLDQIVVAPERWGAGIAAALLDEAKRIAPTGIALMVNKDNARAIRFYAKHGFIEAGEDINPVSGRPVNKMSWRPR